MPRRVLLILLFLVHPVRAEMLVPERLGVVFDRDDPVSVRLAHLYAERRAVPAVNLVGLSVPHAQVIDREQLRAMRDALVARLPSGVQSLLLVWSQPYAVECMSITTAMAAGYQPGFCEPGCARTTLSPLYDEDGWLPADTVGWLPAMLLPTRDEDVARKLIERGIAADGSNPPGTVVLVRTFDTARNVRARGYRSLEALLGRRIGIVDTPPPDPAAPDAANPASTRNIIAYFTGAATVAELPMLQFRPGAAADHLTSYGGQLAGSSQMPALAWLRQGATASYGTVSEPCAHVGKFPDPAILLAHYLRGETLLEAYWKSVAMPGQGLFIGEPLARPFAAVPW